jgi:hypothetical protein
VSTPQLPAGEGRLIAPPISADGAR